MATKAAVKAKQAYIQYSKRMCTAVAIFWMIYRLLITLLIFFRVSGSDAFVRLTEGADTVMIVNMGFYSGNSIAEKVSLAWVKRSQTESKNNSDEKDEDDDSQG